MFRTFLSRSTSINCTLVICKFLKCSKPKQESQLVLCFNRNFVDLSLSRHTSRPYSKSSQTIFNRFSVTTSQLRPRPRPTPVLGPTSGPTIFAKVYTCLGTVNVPNRLGICRAIPAHRHMPLKYVGLQAVLPREKSTSSNGQGIHENISALQMKKRPLRRKLTVDEKDGFKPGFWSVVAYTTAEEYDLEKLAFGLTEQDLYEVYPWESGTESIQSGSPDVVHARALYQVGSESREIFFFREGSIVLWNVPDLEVENVLQFVRHYENNSYDARLLTQESDSMQYTYAQPGKKSHLDTRQGTLVVEEAADSDLSKYTFSNAMALSVKLGVWEASLDRYVNSIEFVTEDLKQGTKIRMSRDEVLRKTGQLFALRHLINLSSDLLDTPDFYWDRDELEALYLQTCNYFSIARRTKVMNEKLNHCVELVDLLSDHLNDRHHVRLEWMIIILIMVEVGFEVIHYVDRWSG